MMTLWLYDGGYRNTSTLIYLAGYLDFVYFGPVTCVESWEFKKHGQGYFNPPLWISRGDHFRLLIGTKVLEHHPLVY